MARKSREAMWREALEAVSECPSDLFSVITPENEIVALAKEADSGDITATEELIRLIKEEGKDSPDRLFGNEALPYLCVKGVALGSRYALDTIIYGINNLKFNPLLYENAVQVLENSPLPYEYECAKLAYAVEKIGLSDDKNEIRSLISTFERGSAESLYAHCLIKKKSDEPLSVDAESTAKILGIYPLPFYNNGKENGDKNSLKRIVTILNLHTSYEWRDFWFFYLYEYARLFLGGDLGSVAYDAAEIALQREFSSDRFLHAYAFLELFGGPDQKTKEKKQRLSDEHIFLNGTAPDKDRLGEVIRECVSLSSRKAAEEAKKSRRRGEKIVHVKNRFSLEAELTSHIKRGKKHVWQTKLFFPADEQGKPPVFDFLYVSNVRYAPARNGVSPEGYSDFCQVVLTSELSLGSVRHPFTLDFLLDIAYVSATKCEVGELIVKKASFDKDGYILDCEVMLY